MGRAEAVEYRGFCLIEIWELKNDSAAEWSFVPFVHKSGLHAAGLHKIGLPYELCLEKCFGDYALIDRRRMLLVRDGTIRQSGSPSPTVAAGSGPTVPLVADRRNLHTDAGVPPVSRRQALAAKAEFASFRDS